MTSRLRIAEYQGGNYAGIQAPDTRTLVARQVIDFTDGLEHKSGAFSGDTRLVEISTNASCAVFCSGTSPTAIIDDQFMPAGGLRVYIVAPGGKLSVIADS